MSALSSLDTLIHYVIIALLFWFFSNIYIFLVFCFNFSGIHYVLFDFRFWGSDICSYAHRFLLLIANIFLCIVLSLLGWIFIAWIIILIFVPSIIIFTIPIPPFFIPVPLKTLILTFVPPFKFLTQRGILPFCLRVLLIFFSADTLKQKFSKSFTEAYGLLYDDMKKVLGEILEPPQITITANDEDIKKLPNVDQGTNNDEIARKLIETDNKGSNKEVMELINEELELCLQSKQSLTPPNSRSTVNAAMDMNNYAECYAKSVQAYLDNKL